MTYDNTNRGVLFRNDKDGVEGRPDYRGTININGAEFWLSAWIKEGKSGKFMSLSVKPKEEKLKPRNNPPPADENLDADVPF